MLKLLTSVDIDSLHYSFNVVTITDGCAII